MENVADSEVEAACLDFHSKTCWDRLNFRDRIQWRYKMRMVLEKFRSPPPTVLEEVRAAQKQDGCTIEMFDTLERAAQELERLEEVEDLYKNSTFEPYAPVLPTEHVNNPVLQYWQRQLPPLYRRVVK